MNITEIYNDHISSKSSATPEELIKAKQDEAQRKVNLIQEQADWAAQRPEFWQALKEKQLVLLDEAMNLAVNDPDNLRVIPLLASAKMLNEVINSIKK